MKKYFIFLAVLLFGLLTTLESCNKQDDLKSYELKETKEMKSLLIELENYNKAYFKDQPQMTRSLISRLKRLLRVTYVDAVGAIVGSLCGPWGAVGGAALCSGIVFCADGNLESGGPMLMRFDPIIDEPFEPEGPCQLDYIYDDYLDYTILPSILTACTDSIGYNHNSILRSLGENDMLDITPYNLNLVISSICNQADTLTNFGRGYYTNSDLLQSMNFYQLKALCENSNYTLSFDSFVAQFIILYPEYSYELSFLQSYITSLCNIDQPDNDGTYATGVLSLIYNSNINEALKKRLGDAVITGNASARLWNLN